MPTLLDRKSARLRATATSNGNHPAESDGDDLSPEKLEELWREYRRVGCEVIRTRLIIHYMQHHVRRIAQRIHSTLPRQVELDDLVQEGYRGLVDAMERFDIERDIKFETFSTQRVFGAIHDYLRKLDPTPRQVRKMTKQIQAAEEAFRKEYGRTPADEELRKESGVPEPAFRKLVTRRHAALTLSFHGATSNSNDDGDDEFSGLGNFIDERSNSPISEAEREGLREWLIKGLDQRDRLIVTLYYYEELTMKEIGRALGISESRVSQRLDSILQCLRSRLSYSGAENEFKV